MLINSLESHKCSVSTTFSDEEVLKPSLSGLLFNQSFQEVGLELQQAHNSMCVPIKWMPPWFFATNIQTLIASSKKNSPFVSDMTFELKLADWLT